MNVRISHVENYVSMIEECAMGRVFALMDCPIHVLFMDVTERNAGMNAYAMAILWAFAIRISIVTTTENHVVFEF